ncbi:DNA repair protein RecN [Commensalibacter sp. Nvir]|uniref:DNA repair protein RecN n=1 Tax=Commensalibacter sp. Nvir TaxID=3069817 RepID=UPI002D3D5B76|nr:DNA repair protein RecN [Commensalibacter sp. Nvir]
MLTQLSIRNVVLIEKLDLYFDQGLTVLTGETGAGKSILLDSLGLVLGDRASTTLIRAGANQASVTACFEVIPTHPIFSQFTEQGLEIAEAAESELVIRRVITVDGRSRAYINDQPIGISFLREIAQSLVEMQGQYAQVGLMDQRTHLLILDSFGVSSTLIEQNQNAYKRWIEATAQLAALKKTLEATAKEEEWLRSSVKELKQLSPQKNEEIELATQRKNLQYNERKLEALSSALNLIAPQDRRAFQPAQTLLNASKVLQRLLPSVSNPEGSSYKEEESVQEILEALTRAEESLGEAETILNRLINTIEINPQKLDTIEERLFGLRAISRKFNVSINELPLLLDDFEKQLLNLDLGNHEVKTLEMEVHTLRRQFEETSENLHKERQNVALQLQTSVEKELKPLKLEKARFVVSFTSLPKEAWNYTGKDQVQFLIAANPGVPPAPLNKAASGGELSRLLLALKVVISRQSTLSALVFDEIDAGVGGATASAIGERLHRIAKTVQVFAVTHSPQIAASADAQFKIAKTINEGMTFAYAQKLNRQERREEIARMLAGNQITDAARAAADSLLDHKKS